MSLRFEIFPSDLDATADFYVQVLGFTLVRDERAGRDAYLALHRDGVQVGAAGRPPAPDPEQRRPPVGVELVLEVDDLDEERGRVERAGWPVVEDVTSQPWGLRDFRLVDPSGYYLRVTERSPGDGAA
jgi:lactoylglutathione lyase